MRIGVGITSKMRRVIGNSWFVTEGLELNIIRLVSKFNQGTVDFPILFKKS